MDNIAFYGVTDIANWQLAPNDSGIDLPELQRGFVWKTNQIEGLWDSLLRGFPIGSFLLSKDGNGKLFILDGQQRATSIALGAYNPWENNGENQTFWSLKKVPVLWIDLSPKEKTATQKYVLRLVTQSHPWGYQLVKNSAVLSISERRNALSVFRENENNKEQGYTLFSLRNVFPYDSYLPVPLAFLFESVKSPDWQGHLLALCKCNLPYESIRTKHLKGNYLEKLEAFVRSDKFDSTIIQSIKNLDNIKIPCIIANKEILESEDEQIGEDPTLFVRLNSSGTPIAGEDLIYSIYKAAFPNSKKLIEHVGLDFISPSLIISLSSRLVWSELHGGEYPYPIGVNEFRKRIRSSRFTQKLNVFIGDEKSSLVSRLFQTMRNIFQSEGDLDIPPVLIKNLVSGSSDLLLMILQWLKKANLQSLLPVDKRRILAVFTALNWFGRDNARYVREIWGSLSAENPWNKCTLRRPYYHNNEYIMYPLVQPSLLREFLLERVVQKKVVWNNLYTKEGDAMNEQYRSILEKNFEDKEEAQNLVNDIWGNFINKLVYNKPLLLFAQREYINKNFVDFNQLDNLDDTNAPWDWDHIYPSSWVYGKRYVNENTRHWTWTIGNLRAISLEDNRSESNRNAPAERLAEVKSESFIKDNDWPFWEKITDRIYDGQKREIKNHLCAIIHRLCNIYEEWYNTLNIGGLFNFLGK
jgi:hypothetical protein